MRYEVALGVVMLLGCFAGSAASGRAAPAVTAPQRAGNVAAAQGGQDLEIHMQLIKSAILLGEPDWVDVTVTNRSQDTLNVDTSAVCFFVPDSEPLKVDIPAAEQGGGQPKPTARNGGGDCYLTSERLAAGDSVTLRYVLAGDFHFTHPGRYPVQLERTVKYAPVPADNSSSWRRRASQQTARANVVLEVQPANAARLLSIEQAVAEEVKQRSVLLPRSTASYADQEALERANVTQRHAFQFRDALAEGLADYPVAGMEPVFEAWVSGRTLGRYGHLGLNKLDEASRGQ